MSYKFDTAKMIQCTHFFESVLFHKTREEDEALIKWQWGINFQNWLMKEHKFEGGALIQGFKMYWIYQYVSVSN